MNKQDMMKIQVQTGSLVDIQSRTGRMDNVEVIEFDLPENSVMAYFPEANILCGTEVDPRSKTPASAAARR